MSALETDGTDYPDLKAPLGVYGINFGSNDPLNPTWDVGEGLDVVPIQGWSPTK